MQGHQPSPGTSTRSPQRQGAQRASAGQCGPEPCRGKGRPGPPVLSICQAVTSDLPGGQAQSLAQKPVYPRNCPRARGVRPRPAANTQSLGDSRRTHVLLVPGDSWVCPSGWPPSEGPQGLVRIWGPADSGSAARRPPPHLGTPSASSAWASWLHGVDRGRGPPSRGGGRGDSILRTEPLRDAVQPLLPSIFLPHPDPVMGIRRGWGAAEAQCAQREVPCAQREGPCRPPAPRGPGSRGCR